MESGAKRPGPTSFWESRTGWSHLKHKLLLEPLPGGSRWAAAFGSLLLFTFVVQAITGILLSMNYASSVGTAWASVKFIQEEVQFGWLIRAMHHWGSSAMVILLLFHLVQVFVWGAYKRPRELTWMAGVLLLGCTLGLAFTGYLLPWDQKAYWATKVGLGIGSTVPLIGDSVKTLLQGGPQIGNLTLTRFFTLHVFILPGLLVLLAVVHLYLFRVHGVTSPWWESADRLKALEEPFWPGQVWKDVVFAFALMIGLGVWCLYHPAPLEAMADPSQIYEARPEWYFMFLFQLLRYFQGPYEIIGTFVLPSIFFLILFFWPFFDRGPHCDPRRRPVAMGLLSLGTVGLVGLTIFAVATDVRMREPALAATKPAAPPERAGPIQKLEVAKVYQTECTACHEVDGTGNMIRKGMPTIPDFTSLAWQMSQTDLEITHRIQNGNEPLMPAYKDKLTKDQILALAIYVRAFSVGPTTAPGSTLAQATPVPEPQSKGAASPPGEAQSTPKPESKSAVPIPSAPRPVPKYEASPPLQIIVRMEPDRLYGAYCKACHDVDGRGGLVRKPMPEIPDFTDAAWEGSRTDADLLHSILEGKGKFMRPMKDKLAPPDAQRLVAFVRAFQKPRGAVTPESEKPAAVAVEATKSAAVLQPPKPTAESQQSKPPVAVARGRSASAPAPIARVTESLSAFAAPAAATVERTRVATVRYREFCLSCHGIDGKGTEMRPNMPTIPDFTVGGWQASKNRTELAMSILDGKGTLMPSFRERVAEVDAQNLVAYIRAFGPRQTHQVESIAPAAPTSDFENQFRQLQRQWDELEKQLRELPPLRAVP